MKGGKHAHSVVDWNLRDIAKIPDVEKRASLVDNIERVQNHIEDYSSYK